MDAIIDLENEKIKFRDITWTFSAMLLTAIIVTPGIGHATK